MTGRSLGLTAAETVRLKAGVHTPAADAGSTVPVKNPIEIGKVIAGRRKELGLSQQALADLAGVGRRLISEVESGKPTTELGKVLGLLQSLGFDLFVVRR